MITVVLACLLLQDPTITNGSFEEWQGSTPLGWSVGVGATNSSGSAPSSIAKGTDGGISLSGTASTGKWFALSQDIDLQPGQHVRISFQARARNLEREGNQFRNHFVSIRHFSAQGKPFGVYFRTISAPEWSSGEIIASRPGNAVRTEILLFLSVSGTLEAKGIRCETLKPEDSFNVLVRHMNLYYSYFHHKGVNWEEVVSRHRNTKSTFVDQIKSMLSELRDGHIWIIPPGKEKIPTWRPPTDHNYDFHAVSKKLAEVKQIGRNSLVGRTKEGFGYVAIGSLMGDGSIFAKMEKEMEARFDAPAFIVDLRGNGGGYEGNASRIAALFCDTERIYAKAAYRSGSSHDAFTDPINRTIAPRKGRTFTKPVVCLIGQACVSSGEGMALMFRSFPHATLLGQPTRGASGNPQPVTLPNGVKVWFSRWVAMTPDHSILEGEGIKPDHFIKHEGKGDPTFDAAVNHLGKELAD